MNVALEDAHRVTCYSKKTEILEPLLDLLRDKSMRARSVAGQALAKLRDGRAMPALASALRDESPVVRMQAVIALGEMDHPEAVEPLLTALTDDDVRVRREASFALGKCGDTRACDSLNRLSEGDPENEVRRAACEAVKKLVADPTERRIYRALEKNEIEDVVTQGATVIPYLESLIRSCADPGIRNAAARVVGRIGGASAIVPLAVAIDDEDQQVRMAAILALAKNDDMRTVGLLITALRDAYWMGREEAAKALGLKGDRRAVDPLRQLTRDGELYLREAARGAIEILTRGW